MKTTKTIIIATIVTIFIIYSTALALPVKAEEFYPKLTIVVSCEPVGESLWNVACMDHDGHVWEFLEDCDPWNRGDIANLLMIHTNDMKEDDEIVEVWYEGHVDDTNKIW